MRISLQASRFLQSALLLHATKAAVLSQLLALANPTALNVSSVLDFKPNSTLLGAIDPNKFTVKIQYGSESLPANSVLMNAVNTMTELALQDWGGRMARSKFVMDVPRFSQIEIFIGPQSQESGATFPRAFGLLGLFEVMASILTDPTRRFRSIRSTLLYQGSLLGYLTIKRRDVGGAALAASEPSATLQMSHANASVASDLTALSAPAWTDDHLVVALEQGIVILTIYEIFYIVFAMLRSLPMMAVSQPGVLNPRRAQVRNFITNVEVPYARYPIEVNFKNSGDTPRTPQRPPYFAYETLIKAMGRLPLMLIEKNDFRSIVQMTLTVDGIQVGEGHIVRRLRPSIDLSTS